MQTKGKIYGNCSVLSPDGILMFRCNQKKANWYLNRNLADVIQNEPLIIKLNFTPNGLGNHNKGYGLSEMKNRCINCGNEQSLTRHHIVPISYRRFFPVEIKSHNFHDVLPMCAECHGKYERKADVLKKELCIKYKVPEQGRVILNKLFKYIKLAKSLLGDNIPDERRVKISNQIKNHLGLKRLTKKRLESLSKMQLIVERKTHAEILMKKISDIDSFIELW